METLGPKVGGALGWAEARDPGTISKLRGQDPFHASTRLFFSSGQRFTIAFQLDFFPGILNPRRAGRVR